MLMLMLMMICDVINKKQLFLSFFFHVNTVALC